MPIAEGTTRMNGFLEDPHVQETTGELLMLLAGMDAHQALAVAVLLMFELVEQSRIVDASYHNAAGYSLEIKGVPRGAQC